jgi:hypothetical protein
VSELRTEGSEATDPPKLGKRRRKRNAKAEAKRRVKRQKANPRKRPLGKEERVNRSKLRQAERGVVWSGISVGEICRTKRIRDVVKGEHDLEAVLNRNFTVVQWDGM